MGKALPGGLRPYLIAALALVLVHLVLRFEDVMRVVGRRQLKYGGNTLVLVLSVLGLLGGLNYVVSRNTQALRPHQGPALQPLGPDAQGAGRPAAGRQDHLLPARRATWRAARTA